MAAQITIPTGYESLQRQAEQKRALAKLMLEKGLMQQGSMQSPLQVLAALAQAYVGKQAMKKADKLDDDVTAKMLSDYRGKLDTFNTDAKTLSPADLVAKYQGDPILADALKPYAEAFSHGLTEAGEHTNFGGQWMKKGDIKDGAFEPNKPTDRVLRTGPDGKTFSLNPVAVTGALASQANTTVSNPVTSIRDPMADQGTAPASTGLPPVPSPVTDTGGLDINLLSPEEKEIMARELKRRAGGGQFVDPHAGTPHGNPLTALPLPSGVVDGKPYWQINGQYYDNPEGR